MMMIGILLLVLLLCANAVWELVCALWMARAIADLDARPPHWALWREAEDSENPAARLLWIALVVQWALTRVFAVMCLTESELWLVIATYEVEALLTLAGAGLGLMRVDRACVTATLCQVCVVAVVYLMPH
jgi:hypothetical protein